MYAPCGHTPFVSRLKAAVLNSQVGSVVRLGRDEGHIGSEGDPNAHAMRRYACHKLLKIGVQGFGPHRDFVSLHLSMHAR